MKNFRAASLMLSLLLATGVAGADLVIAAKPALAADKAKTVSPTVGKPLQEALAAQKAGKIKDAITKAEEADKAGGAKKTPYETYMIQRILAGLYAQQQDYPNAVKSLEAAQATGEMSPEESATAVKQIAGSYYGAKNYAKAIEFGNKYLKDVNANDTDILVMVAQAQYLQKNYKAASDGIHATIRAAQAGGKPVKEDWLQLLMSSEHEQGNDAGTQAALEQLIAVNPKEEYWKNMIAYSERSLRGGSNKTNLDLDVVKFQVGTLTTPQEYTEMAELALQDGLPGLAKKVVDKGMAAGVLGQGAAKDREARLSTMANSQADADQKQLAKGESDARNAKNGDPLVKVGEAYWSYGQYDKAVELIQAGIAKGVTSADDAKLRLGIVYISAGKKAQAADAFKGIAPGSPPAQLAKLWTLAANSPPRKA